jgi:PAS domain S-box-containing protein
MDRRIGVFELESQHSSLVKRIWRVQTDTMNIPPGLGDALLATASDAIIATDRSGIVTFWNPGAERIFGFNSLEAVGQSLDLIIPDNLKARHWSGYHRTMATGESRYGHGDLLAVPGLTKDGRRISVEFTILMLRDAHDRPAGTAAVLRDVTKRFEETRELRRKLAQSTQVK